MEVDCSAWFAHSQCFRPNTASRLMETDSSPTIRRSVAQIIREDELPPTLLREIGGAVQQHTDADELYRWTMQLSPYLETRSVERIGLVIQNALEILNGGGVEGNDAVTLSETTRETLRTLRQNDDDISGPATYVLGFDLLTRAYNRSRPPQDPAESPTG